MRPDESSDLAVLTVQTLTRLRALAKDLEARGRRPAIRAALRLEIIQ